MPGPWSPSSVRDYMSCPRKWALKRQGTPERPMPFSPGLIAGTAFHRGMEAYWTGGNVQQAVEDAVSLAWPQEGAEGHDPGKVCSTVLLGVHRGYESLTLEDPMDLVGAEVVLGGPEEEALRHGRYPGTADLVTRLPDGTLCVTDYKTHWSRDARYSDAEIRETQRSWQLKQYAWFAQERYGTPVTKVRKLLVFLGPVLKLWPVEYAVSQDMLKSWYRQAGEVWGQMDTYAETEFWGVPQHDDACERYSFEWRCSYYNICWEGA